MSETVEIEFKNLLVKAEYDTLYQAYAFQNEPAFTQTNLYFDTPEGMLGQAKWALRIRILETTEKAEATLKTPLAIGLLETTAEIPFTLAQACAKSGNFPELPEITKKLATLNVTPQALILTGQLTTRRSEKKLSEGLLVLDENWYGDVHDYELEFETLAADTGEIYFKNLLEAYHIPKRVTLNKIRRMLSEKSSKKMTP